MVILYIYSTYWHMKSVFYERQQSPIMQVKETHIARGVSPFITKAGASPIPSPITKVGAPPFIMKAGVSPFCLPSQKWVHLLFS
jgi:hypothetical protein